MTSSPWLQFCFDLMTIGVAVFLIVVVLVNVAAKVLKR